jgi:hypothetical protein
LLATFFFLSILGEEDDEYDIQIRERRAQQAAATAAAATEQEK